MLDRCVDDDLEISIEESITRCKAIYVRFGITSDEAKSTDGPDIASADRPSNYARPQSARARKKSSSHTQPDFRSGKEKAKKCT